jgi:hypothetical protein
MVTNNNSGLLTGKIENLDTGEITDVNHYLLSTGSKISTIVKIINNQSFTHPDNSYQIIVDCFALDSIGDVFKLTLNFTPEDKNEMLRIETVLKQSLCLCVEGEYTISQDKLDITIHDPIYSSLPHDLSENDVKKVFKFNR